MPRELKEEMVDIHGDPPFGKDGAVLRVLHVVLSLDVGGLERNVVNQVREGQLLGQDVSVVCLERPGVLASQVEALAGRLLCLEKPPGIQLSMVRRTRETFRQLRPDVVHTHQIATLFYAGLAAKGVPGLHIVHTEHGREAYASRARTRWLGRLAGLQAELFFCLTEDMAAHVIAHRIVPCRKIRIIHNGIDITRYQQKSGSCPLRGTLGIPHGATVIGTIGRLVDVKRQDLLIHGFSRLKGTVPSAHLILVGDGPLRSELGQLVDSLGLKDSVHFVGYQPEAWKYLHMMDVFALTSSSEGMPQAVLEASVAGIPVVASRVGGLPEVIDDGRTGILFPPGDVDSLTRSLVELSTCELKARRMGAAARTLVEFKFNIRRMASDYHRHFLELTEPRE